jgi:hypothetical protein
MTAVTSLRQPRGTAFALRDPLAWDAFADVARSGEELGHRAVFLSEITGRDAFTALGSSARLRRERESSGRTRCRLRIYKVRTVEKG